MTNIYSLLAPWPSRLFMLPLVGLLAYPVRAQTSASFAPATAYSAGAGSFPTAIAVADVNGDNKLDLLTANSGTSTAGVLLGTGTGSFGPVTTYSTGPSSRPYDIAVADVNHDGKPDLLTANQNSNTVGVLLGTGTGSFDPVITYNTGAFPFAIAVADVNKDGNPDLLTANLTGGSFSVLLGTGTGSFGVSTTYSTSLGSQPRGLTVADVNGDGQLDVLSANTSSNVVALILGTSNGMFGSTTSFTGTTYSTGANSEPRSVAAADVNGDGRLDLLTTNNNNGTFGVLLATSAGSFSPVTTYSTGPGTASYPRGLAVTDVNKDGKLDLLAVNQGGSSAAVLLGTGTGSFGPVTNYSTIPTGTTTGTDPYDIAVADVNGDGYPDLLTANNNTNSAGVLLGVAPAPLPVQLVSFAAQAQPAAVALAWRTATELHADRFEAERSVDGLHFEHRGTIAAAGTSLGAQAYSFLDSSLPLGVPQLYYRLRQVDQDGTATYSPVRVVHVAPADLTLYPNPASHSTTLSGAASKALVEVYDLLGRLVLTSRADAAGTARLALPAALPRGIYLVRSGHAPAQRLTVE